MLSALTPFLILLVVALVFQLIPMEPTLKRVGYIVIAIVALILILRFSGLF